MTNTTLATPFLLSAYLACVFLSGQAHAEVLELEGTVKAIDSNARTIRIDRRTPKGTKTLELEVNKKAGDLSSVKVGDRLTFSYDPELEIVTKIGTSDEGGGTLTKAGIKKPSVKAKQQLPNASPLVGMWIGDKGWGNEFLADKTARNLNPNGQVDAIGTWKDEGQGQYSAQLGSWRWQIVLRGDEIEVVRYLNGELKGNGILKRRR